MIAEALLVSLFVASPPARVVAESAAPRLQTFTNPTTIEFTPSVDHSVVMNGVNLVTAYHVDVFPAAGGAVVASRDIGKPTPVSNLITYTQLNTLLTVLPAGSYVVKVAAVGPGGAAATPASAPFFVAVRAPAAPSGVPVVR